MSKKTKYFSFAIAIIAVATVMTIAIYAATSASATMTANVSWTATAGIEFELEAWAVNNASQNGIGNTTVPRSITKQVVTTATTNQSASGLGGDLSCNFYDGTNDGVNNPSSIIFTYKITNTGDTVILIKATKTPNTADESGTTASTHKPAVALGVEIDGVVKGGAVSKVIGSEGYKIQPNSTFEYIVILSIASADINVQNFDAGVSFGMELSSGTTVVEVDRTLLYNQNGQIVSGTTASGNITTDIYYGAYPQTYVGESLNSSLISAFNAEILEKTGKTYTTYLQDQRVVLEEYYYMGNYYAYLTSAKVYEKGYIFSTGEVILTGEDYFFKVEPLKWTNYSGLFLCENAIVSMRHFYKEWVNSGIRSWLNDVFYVESGLQNIIEEKSIIQNNTTGGERVDGAGIATEDYIWLPSCSEIDSIYTISSDRNCDNTDFTKATYGVYSASKLATYWWTRSAYSEEGFYYVGNTGYLDGDTSCFGVRPCFSL